MDQHSAISPGLTKFMRTGTINGGRPAWRLYILMRKHFEAIYRQLTPVDVGEGRKEMPPYSIRQLAAQYKVSPTLMLRLLNAIDQYAEPLAKRDFEAIEKDLFSPFGNYKVLPFYRQHIQPLYDKNAPAEGAGEGADSGKPPRKRPGPKPGSKRNKKSKPSSPQNERPLDEIPADQSSQTSTDPVGDDQPEMPAFPVPPMSQKARELNHDIKKSQAAS